LIKPKINKIKPALILLISLVAIFSTAAISYAKFQQDSSLLNQSEQTAGSISGKFISLADAPAEVEVEVPEEASGPSLSGPSRFVIPDIGVNARMESLGLTSDNAVDVPKSLWTVAWFNRSSKIGSPGPAMIVGHYSGYGRAVFSNLHKLKTGQKIIVVDENNQQHVFAVKNSRSYPQSEVPMAELLGNTASKPRLEIITCGGGFIKETRDFTNRTVITAELV
jgi:sortase (surface protein transpeptidase)